MENNNNNQKQTLKEKIAQNLEGTTGNAFERLAIIFGTTSQHFLGTKWIGYIVGFLIAVVFVSIVNSGLHAAYHAITGPEKPTSYRDITAYELVAEEANGIQPPKKNDKLMNFVKNNKGLRISGYVSGVSMDGNMPIVTIAPFLEYSLTNDLEVRMADHMIGIEGGESKDLDNTLKSLRRGDYVSIECTYIGFDDSNNIHFKAFNVSRNQNSTRTNKL